MLDLDSYINNSIKIKMFGEEYDILEPTMQMVMEIDKIEADLKEDNVNEKRLEVFLLFLNHNRQGKSFAKEDACKLPFEAISNTIAEISALRYEAESDPNLKSRSQKGK